MNKPRIIAVHLQNDYTGSPLILSQALQGFVKNGYEVDLFTSGHEGFLSNIKGVRMHKIRYAWSSDKLVTLWRFFKAQCYLFMSMFQYRRKHVIFYVNTMLPFGAALAGRIMNKKVLYHMHEPFVNPAFLNSFLLRMVNICADGCLTVSNYLKETLKDIKVKKFKVYNALSEQFLAFKMTSKKKKNFKVLMVCSLRVYKGVLDFYELSKMCPDYTFNLVVSADQKEIDEFFKDKNVPPNLVIYSLQKNMHPFYAQSHVLLSLSHPEKWTESFGMTVLEAMSYKLPCIVPRVGGITELVEEGVSGFQLNYNEKEAIVKKLHELSGNTDLYAKMSYQAEKKANCFSMDNMQSKIIEIVELINGKELSPYQHAV